MTICRNGPIVAIGTIYYNEHVLGEVKKMFRADLRITPGEAGQLYFIRLRRQWEQTSEPRKTEIFNMATLF